MKNMNRKYIILIIVVIIFMIVAVPTSYKIIKNYNSKSYLVVEKKIIEAAEKCFNEEKCSGEEITLKDLYDNKYLDKMVNPVTKKIYNENLKIIKSDEGFKVNVH